MRVLEADQRRVGERAEKIGLVARRAATSVRDNRAVGIEEFLELLNVCVPSPELQVVRKAKGCRVSRG